MKQAKLLSALMLVGMVLASGCDKMTSMTAPQKKPRPSVAAVPDLEILGVTEEEQIALRDLLIVRGLLQQAQDYVVIINTQLVRKGETMQMKVQKDTYDVRVLSITEMRVVLEAARRAGAPPAPAAKPGPKQ
ncbi:MAG: hypothetical protein JXB04_13345 [Kiritimatiellae bacterium]|nr:hypothetical protein [Kiritimatiellia bacterium]